MPRSEARVTTDRPQRYAKQLAAHLGRKVESSWDEEAGLGSVTFSMGTATLTAEPGVLLLAVEGEAENLGNLESVVGRHLVASAPRTSSSPNGTATTANPAASSATRRRPRLRPDAGSVCSRRASR